MQKKKNKDMCIMPGECGLWRTVYKAGSGLKHTWASLISHISTHSSFGLFVHSPPIKDLQHHKSSEQHDTVNKTYIPETAILFRSLRVLIRSLDYFFISFENIIQHGSVWSNFQRLVMPSVSQISLGWQAPANRLPSSWKVLDNKRVCCEMG